MANDHSDDSQPTKDALHPPGLEWNSALDAIVETAREGIALIDPAGRIVFANKSMADMFGYSNEDLAAGRLCDFVLEPDQAEFARRCAGRLQGFGKPYDVCFRCADGSELWAIAALSLVPGENGELRGTLVMLTDISERKRAEELARREKARAVGLANIARTLNSQLEIGPLLNTICVEAARTLNVPISAVGLYDRSQGLLEVADAVGLPPQELQELTALALELSLQGAGVQNEDGVTVFPNVAAVNDDRFQELCWRHDIGRLASVAMVRDQSLVGVLCAFDPGAGRGWNDDDLALLGGLADQAAQAITTVRLLEEVRGQTQKLQALSQRLAEAQEVERARLARELHDRIGQNLTALGINLSILRSTARKARPRIEDSQALVEDMVRTIRSLMSDLRPPLLDDYGLAPALRWYAKQFSDRTGIETQVTESPELSPRPAAGVESALFRITQEALTNVAKHSQATLVIIETGLIDGTVRLVITDNGVGFAPLSQADLSAARGLGLVNISERTTAVGGRCRIEPRPSQGVRIIVEVPQ
jgi:PAS domain S-box-containing protein